MVVGCEWFANFIFQGRDRWAVQLSVVTCILGILGDMPRLHGTARWSSCRCGAIILRRYNILLFDFFF